MIQTLECRSFLSAVLSSTGLLTVTGKPANDMIFFYARGGYLAVSDDGVINVFDPTLIKKIVVTGGDGNDSVSLGTRNFKTAIYGEKGNDTLTGGPGKDTLYGGDGDDLLNGRAGRDNLRGGLGSDLMFGGDGTDTADYIDRTDAITVSIGGGYNDGALNEHDNVVADIENLRGSQSDSVLIGNGGPNYIESGKKTISHGYHVTLRGMGGNDVVIADYSTLAVLDGGTGNDDLYDYSWGTLQGGGGNDLLYSWNFQMNEFDGGTGHDIASGDFKGASYEGIKIIDDSAINVEKISSNDTLPHFLTTAEKYWTSIGGR